MKLSVRVIEARNLPAMDLNGLSDPYVKLQLGKQRSKTKVVKKSLNPNWAEDFGFRVEDLNEELLVSVLDEDKYFNDDFVGQLRVPVSQVFDAENKSLLNVWYPLQPKNKKSKNRDCGEILLSIFFSRSDSFADLNFDNRSLAPSLRKDADLGGESPLRSFGGASNMSSPGYQDDFGSSREEKPGLQKTIAGRIAQIFNKNTESASATVSGRGIDLSEISETSEPENSNSKSDEDESSSDNFEELMNTMTTRDEGSEIPSNLPGGVILDRLYAVTTSELNSLLFSQNSSFPKSLAELQCSTELNIGSWKLDSANYSVKRMLTYVKAATKLLKAVKASEEQTYLKADGKAFAVLASVSTPDVIYGSTFKTEVLYCIMPGPELPSGEQTSRLVISWRTNFLQSTMMRGMIENGTRQGLKESYEQFATLLSQNVKPVDLKDLGSNKEQALAELQVEYQSDWKLATQYLANFTGISTIIVGVYVLIHIWLAVPNPIQALEFAGLDLPDSIGELVVCIVLVLQAQRMLGYVSRFIQARGQRGSDHGVRAQGDGWLLTVALIEGSNLAAVDPTGFSDPYVVFTCNGKSRTSSIKFQQLNPRWNEIFEFDAMDEAPSMMDVEVYDFDGPFDDAKSLGRVQVNFLKRNLSDLADFWIPLQGKLAQPCQSKLHLRIFLNNTRAGNAVEDYLSKMEKEVGKKINIRSPQTNSTFQKLFELPSEEFLINDFTCHLKRKMPLQGRLCLSPRIIGFHANLFGHKTKFFFLWEDIEDIQIFTPTLSSMGSPIMVITLLPGRGMDAKHGAKTRDDGRLKFHFQSFVSFNVANRTIMALWKARSLSPEQKLKMIDESEAKSLQSEESGAFLALGDVTMSEVYSTVASAPTRFFMEFFNGGELEQKVMEKAGCVDYSHTPWESEKGDVYERQTSYKFDNQVNRYGGETRSTQQRTRLSDSTGWVVEEVMTLHGVPIGDFFNLHIRYQVENLPSRPKQCMVKVHFGIAWLKSTRQQKKMTKNILENLQDRMKVIVGAIEREYTAK